MPPIPHKYYLEEPTNCSFKYLVCATALMAILSSGCKDQKLIDDYQKIATENERLKIELADNEKHRLKQERIFESLGAEIKKANKNSEIETEKYKTEISSLKNEIELKTKKIDDISKDIAIRKEAEKSQIYMTKDAMLYIKSEEFAVQEKLEKTLNENSDRKEISEEREEYYYWDFEFDPSKKTLSWNSLESTFSNTHIFYADHSGGYQITTARRQVFDLSDFTGAISVENMSVCGRPKTKLKLKAKMNLTASFRFLPGNWNEKLFKNPRFKKFHYSEIEWKKIDPPTVDLGCRFVMDNDKAARFKSALEAIIKTNGGKVSSF